MSADAAQAPSLGPAVLRLTADHLVTAVPDSAVGDGPLDTADGPIANGRVAGGVIANGALDIDAVGRIVAVGPESELGSEPSRVRRLGGLLMPGLVNAHAHTPMTLVRGAGDGLPLDRWLREGVWPREGRMTPEDAWWGMTIGSAEMLLAGVTTSCEMYFFEEAIVDSVNASGARVVLTPGVVAAMMPDGKIGSRIDEIATFFEANHRPDERVNIGFAPHSVYDLTPEQCSEIASHAQAADALFHIHLEETAKERELVKERYGKTATQVLADAGVLDGRVLAAHGVWLDETDRRLLGQAGAGVAHCPQSNLKLGSGIAPVAKMLEAGITVGVATDGPASNDDLDLWEELKLAPLLARGVDHDPQAMDAATALALATRSSAKAVGLDDVGFLAPGAWADVIRVDTNQPAFTPGMDLLTHLVFSGSSRFVTDVWVAGQQLVDGGTLTTVDVEACVSEAQIRGRRLADVEQ